MLSDLFAVSTFCVELDEYVLEIPGFAGIQARHVCHKSCSNLQISQIISNYWIIGRVDTDPNEAPNVDIKLF